MHYVCMTRVPAQEPCTSICTARINSNRSWIAAAACLNLIWRSFKLYEIVYDDAKTHMFPVCRAVLKVVLGWYWVVLMCVA